MKPAKFQLKLLGHGPMLAKSVAKIIDRAADACEYIAREHDLAVDVRVRRIRPGSLEILYLLSQQADAGNAVAKIALELLVLDIAAAFATLRISPKGQGSAKPVSGETAIAVADVLDAVEDDRSIEGYSVRAGNHPPTTRDRAAIRAMRMDLGGPKVSDLRHKIHIQVENLRPGIPLPRWDITWRESMGWQYATVDAPANGGHVNRFDKLVVDLEIIELPSKGTEAPREVVIQRVYWDESGHDD